MKPLLVIYTPPIDIEYKDENGKTELDHFDEVMKTLSDDYRILHLHFNGIEKPRVELLSIDGTITPLELKRLEERIFALLPFQQPKYLPSDFEVGVWFNDNITNETSASSAIYKFRLWLNDLQK